MLAALTLEKHSQPTFLPFPAYLAYGEHFSRKQLKR